MKRFVINFCLVLFIMSGAIAGPFGLEKGMTLDKVKTACKGHVELIDDDCYKITPPKTHPKFDNYIVWIDPDVGLYYIKAITADIHTNGYGTELKNQFMEILSPLDNKYGKFKLIDYIEPSSLWDDDRYWVMGLCKGDRTCFAYCSRENDNKLPEDINSIGLTIKADYSDTGYIALEYELSNNDEIKTKKQERDEDTF